MDRKLTYQFKVRVLTEMLRMLNSKSPWERIMGLCGLWSNAVDKFVPGESDNEYLFRVKARGWFRKVLQIMFREDGEDYIWITPQACWFGDPSPNKHVKRMKTLMEQGRDQREFAVCLILTLLRRREIR